MTSSDARGLRHRVAAMPVAAKLTLVAVLTTILAVAVSAWSAYDRARSLLIETRVASMEEAISRQQERISLWLDDVREEVIHLSRMPAVQGFLRARRRGGYDDLGKRSEAEWKAALLWEFRQSVEAHGHARLRLIGFADGGRELVRVDAAESGGLRARAISEDRLQAKGDSDSMRLAGKLARGEAYITPMDLNRDHGVVEEPPRLTQRVIAAIFPAIPQGETQATHDRLELAARIRELDSFLTRSVLAAVHSRQIRWGDRYERSARRLDRSLEEALTITAAGDELRESLLTHRRRLARQQRRIVELIAGRAPRAAAALHASQVFIDGQERYRVDRARLLARLEGEAAARPMGAIVLNTVPQQLLTSIESPESFWVAITNTSGDYLLHPEEGRAWDFGKAPGFAEEHPLAWKALVESGHPVVWEDDRETEVHVVGRVDLNAKHQSDFLGVAMTASKADVLAPITELARKALAIAVLAILVTTLFCTIVLRRLTAPIRLLTSQATQIADGDGGAAMRVWGHDEIGRLGAAFANVVEKLEHKTQEAKQHADELSALNETLEARVTDRTADLAHSEARIQAVVDNAADAIVVADAQGHIEAFNPAAERVFGYEAAEVSGLELTVLMPERLRPLYQDGFLRHVRTGRARILGRALEVTALRKDGTEFPFELTVSEASVGENRSFTGIGRDISERKVAERRLLEDAVARATLNELLEASIESTTKQDLCERSLDVLMSLDFLGVEDRGAVYLVEEEPGVLVRQVHRNMPADLDTLCATVRFGECLCGRAASDGTLLFASDVDERHETRYPGMQPHGHYILPIRTDDEVVGVITLYLRQGAVRESQGDSFLRAASDVIATGLKRITAEAELRESYSLITSALEREKHVSARLEQALEDLEDAKGAADAANDAKTAFLANMSHEIRTPMTAILGYAELSRDPGIGPKDRDAHLETIARNGDHLLTVINDILDLSKIEAGRMTIERLPVSPSASVDEVLSLMRVRSAEKQIALDVEYMTRVPRTIQTDPVRLRQILVNLIGNAIKFTDEGGVRVRVSLSPPGSPVAKLRFEVADSGIGMSAGQIERLFTPFTQADPSTTRRFGGTGLGLTICKRLVEMLGGTIDVDASELGGSVFMFEIDPGPLTGVELVSPAEERASPEAAESRKRGRKTPKLVGRILVAEDGPDNQRLIAHLLRKAGLTVVLASNGQEARDLALGADEPFALILMDMQMPIMDGYTATRALRAAGYDAPIVALTANVMTGDRERCLEAGCDDFATKPIDRAPFYRLLGDYLEQHV